MMGDPMFYCIASGLGGLAIGVAAGLSSVLMGDLSSAAAMHRRSRIDAARACGGVFRRRSSDVLSGE
ncbi:hypothetical protein AA0242T_1363 [Acetobacter aceti NRIC 0242]|uniref:Uncharacterized protein n=1 Tax=Acetobacter aceti NBRC 14818 TaxID=887700 RepID=A0AB33IJ04_ACEAC|nr:hypothetical protein [Acetobacter aceti]TCS31774.1 hypothetical protein EDC15_1156 [Acetobacter aceti NBRC 14818]BCK77193.1 hypothetical protein EMQ_2799 [Acetobacter aceti NBRC 14818]GAN58871.1 hypothetical protein Abac_088_002 [Acetobacter aceti NBRC 14818]GBO80661.1 hypothetical protein AA0242T_1363 [Acetobacter aceti NRIC 0242]